MTDKVKNFRDLEEYPKLVAEATPNEKCLPCTLCEPVCPTGAIKVAFNKSREDFGPLREDLEGKISVDKEKCNLCGRCQRFCKAFLLIEKDKKDPRDLVPYDQLLVDEELCDYCGLCARICPEEAIAVEGETLKSPEDIQFSGKVQVDKSLCIGCGKCALVCPYQGIDVKRPFEGKIRLVAKNLPKCDPSGCHGCFNVCPANCWYVDEKGKIAVAEEQCIFCGACANACHCLAIDVLRSHVCHTDLKDVPWAEEWKDAISAVITGDKKRPDVSSAVSPPEIEKPPSPRIEALVRDPELQRLIDDALLPLVPALKKPKIRYILEREKPEVASNEIMARIKKAAEKNDNPKGAGPNHTRTPEES
jgi:4Fe-4S ferredoxin